MDVFRNKILTNQIMIMHTCGYNRGAVPKVPLLRGTYLRKDYDDDLT
jgi:hypothetical protein